MTLTYYCHQSFTKNNEISILIYKNTNVLVFQYSIHKSVIEDYLLKHDNLNYLNKFTPTDKFKKEIYERILIEKL